MEDGFPFQSPLYLVKSDLPMAAEQAGLDLGQACGFEPMGKLPAGIEADTLFLQAFVLVFAKLIEGRRGIQPGLVVGFGKKADPAAGFRDAQKLFNDQLWLFEPEQQVMAKAEVKSIGLDRELIAVALE